MKGRWTIHNLLRCGKHHSPQIGDERIQTLKEVETYVLDQYVYIPQNFVENNYVISEKVEGLNIWPFGSEYDFKNVVNSTSSSLYTR